MGAPNLSTDRQADDPVLWSVDEPNLYSAIVTVEADGPPPRRTRDAEHRNVLAARVSIRVFQSEKEVSAVRFSVWIADDAARTPVSFQADLPFGNLAANLPRHSDFGVFSKGAAG